MDDLVDTVKQAVHNVETAGEKKEVVDLGQSLHLLETKFAGLRAALSAELGAKASKFTSHEQVSKDLMARSSDLVRGIVEQREELKKLAGDVKEVDSAIRAFREGLLDFERDAAELAKIVSDLHASHKELHAAHQEARTSVKEMITDPHYNKNIKGGKHGMFYVLLLVEIAVFVAFLYFKRPGSAAAHKAYGKYG